KQTYPYTYKNTLPIWSDINLPQLTRYIETSCSLSYVRSATPGIPLDLGNCQPFGAQNFLFVHNGYIDNFRQSLYRPIRNNLSDYGYQLITGNTDSEHIFALVADNLNQLDKSEDLAQVLKKALDELNKIATTHQVYFSANTILSDGKQLVASRYANRSPVPSLYWLRDDPLFPQSVIIASEPLFEGDWHIFPEQSIIRVTESLEVNFLPLNS
ncbi:MAG: class II glutamine amidotransferase, partial [Cyanobacteria bacterium J083]